MARPRIKAEVVFQIKSLWLAYPTETGEQIYQRARSRISGCPSLRKVQEIVAEAKKEVKEQSVLPQDPQTTPWGPDWPNDAEEIACLFKLMKFQVGRPLDTSTAKWALRIRKCFSGKFEGSMNHLMRAMDYARIEKAAIVWGPDLFDYVSLDNLMMYRPWESEENQTIMANVSKNGFLPESKNPILPMELTEEELEQIRSQSLKSGVRAESVEHFIQVLRYGTLPPPPAG